MPGYFEWITLFQIPLVLALVWVISRPLSTYIAKVASGQPTVTDRIFSPLARCLYKVTGINTDHQQRWQAYAFSVISLNLTGVFILLVLQMSQGVFLDHASISFLPALNTAISFVTNTDWQSYNPETTLDNRFQMAGLSVQMFLSAGMGMSVALALTRSFINNNSDVKTIGNFWVDCTRMIIWILLPLSFILSLVFTSFGIPQSLYEAIASQEAIKLLGTNGAGFFNAGSAHPLENPSAVCNLVQTGAMLLVVASLPQVFGKMTGEVAQGKTLLKVMFFLYLAMLVLCLVAQWQATHPFGAILEGMDMRFGWVGSIFFNVTATTTGTGATSVALSSLPPLAGLSMLINILSGSVIFGGVGSGLYHIILYALLAVFLAGLMVGRTPEYLGKKIEAFDMKMVVISLMFPAFLILGLTAIAVMVNSNAALNPGPHGLTEIFYAFASTVYNNGSSFAGLKTDSAFYHVTTVIGMVGGRFAVIIAVLALAGNLVQKPGIPVTSGTFPTTGGLFSGLLIAVIIITSGLVFFPIIALGPLAEQVSSCLIPLLP